MGDEGIDLSRRFQVSGPAVVADVIDGETVIMNLDTGDYYSLNASAGVLWHLVVAGHRRGDVPAAINQRHGVTPAAAEIDAFISRLVEHRLVVATEQGDGNAGDVADALPMVSWSTPEIVAYNDMRDLLAMDPPLPQQRRARG